MAFESITSRKTGSPTPSMTSVTYSSYPSANLEYQNHGALTSEIGDHRTVVEVPCGTTHMPTATSTSSPGADVPSNQATWWPLTLMIVCGSGVAERIVAAALPAESAKLVATFPCHRSWLITFPSPRLAMISPLSKALKETSLRTSSSSLNSCPCSLVNRLLAQAPRGRCSEAKLLSHLRQGPRGHTPPRVFDNLIAPRCK